MGFAGLVQSPDERPWNRAPVPGGHPVPLPTLSIMISRTRLSQDYNTMNKLHAFFSLTALSLASVAQAQTAQVASLAPAPGQTVRNWAPAQPGSGYSVTNYIYDDGTSENAQKVWSGAGTWGVACWINGFDAPTGDVITKIDVAFGSALFPNNQPALGSVCNVGVWSDPNQDGSPLDAVLLTQMAGTVTILGDSFQTFTLTTPTIVTGKFFIGAWMACNHTPNEYPAAIDQTTPANGNQFICGSGGTAAAPAAFDPTNLAGAGLPPTPNTLGVYLVRAEGGGAAPVVYCTPKSTSNGCNPSIGFSGGSSATLGSGFNINGTNFINNKSCLLFYGTTGQSAVAFQGGILCVKTPIKRTGATLTGGNPPPNDCSGAPSIDFNAFTAAQPPGSLLQIPGTVVNTQWWGRDPGFAAPNNTQLSDALEFTVGP